MSHLTVVPDEPDQVARLHRFKAAHADIPVILGSGTPTAFVGREEVRRNSLRALLDKLEEMTGDRPADPPVPALRGVQPLLPADEADLPRLEEFTAAHPDISVGRDGRLRWQAAIDGQVITRHWLGQLLDTLERALNGERILS